MRGRVRGGRGVYSVISVISTLLVVLGASVMIREEGASTQRAMPCPHVTQELFGAAPKQDGAMFSRSHHKGSGSEVFCVSFCFVVDQWRFGSGNDG